MIYSGYIECGLEEATYEFTYDGDMAEPLSAMQQLDYLINSGIMQIIDDTPRYEDDDE